MQYIVAKMKDENKSENDIQTRFVCRMLPINILCKASGNMEEFTRLVTPVVKNFINELRDKNQPESDEDEERNIHFSWCIEYKAKNNQKIHK